MNEKGEKLPKRPQRAVTLQNLRKLKAKPVKMTRNASVHTVPLKRIAQNDAEYASLEAKISPKNDQPDLKAMIGNLNRQTLRLINSVRPQKQPQIHQRRHFISDRQLQNSNAKIASLQTQIENLQEQSRNLSTQKGKNELPLMLQIIREEKERLATQISNLKRTIDRNGRQLLRRNETIEERTELLGLYKHQKAIDSKKEKLVDNNLKVIEENEGISLKIKELDAKIQNYQAQITKSESNNPANNQLKYQQKLQKRELLQRTSRRQRKHLQVVYLQKMKDLEYELRGCEAISSKILELQQRIDTDKAEMTFLKQEYALLQDLNQLDKNINNL